MFLQLDEGMIRAAMTPLADSQQHARNWIENHFDKYGDHSPNSLDTHLSISSKKDVWLTYKKEFEEKGMNKLEKKSLTNYGMFYFHIFLFDLGSMFQESAILVLRSMLSEEPVKIY